MLYISYSNKSGMGDWKRAIKTAKYLLSRYDVFCYDENNNMIYKWTSTLFCYKFGIEYYIC